MRGKPPRPRQDRLAISRAAASRGIEPSLVSVYGIALTYASLSVPFVVSGVLVSLALTRFPAQVSALYAVDVPMAGRGSLLAE